MDVEAMMLDANKELRFTVRVRNNRLIKAREEFGLSQTEAARRIGMSNAFLGGLETFREKPWGAKGWTESALKIAAYYGYSPEYLWPETVKELIAKARAVNFCLDVAEAKQIGEQIEARELAGRVQGLLETLTPREQRVLTARFYEEKSLRVVGDEYELTPERIRHIEAKALRKLRHPTRSDALRIAAGMTMASRDTEEEGR